MPQASELLLRFLPPLIEGAATRGLPRGEMSSEICEVNDNFNAVFDVLPQSMFEPSSSFVGAAKVVAFIRCYLRSHFVQVQMRIV